MRSAHKLKQVLLVCMVGVGIVSSTFMFEIAQFVGGYTHFHRAYVPQAFSHLPDDPRPGAYYEVCIALQELGVPHDAIVVSGEFAFRYYCRLDLYATGEEGAAYLQLSRKDLVAWHESYLAQRQALSSGDMNTMRAFARSIGAEVILLPRNEKFLPFEDLAQKEGRVTSRHLIFLAEGP